METINKENITWFKACKIADVPENGGACIKHGEEQIAIFNFKKRSEWYATQNLCPHKMQMVLSRGMIGDAAGEPKVACPFHKKTFNLKDGSCMSGEDYQIKTYPIMIDGDEVFVGVE